ncbi:hypothetical protein [Dokdonella fugitiva]|jgi:hypothetical protein|uniref:hypothetical protein n=1 Tax=Dokdonella fugitiva TaxID=328517 RepID=UPI0015FA74BD|nr:hypothetical protein [Dokdonella fugitiva]MBA8884174.1 hypothetical protein [Dokdonella fugitiva]
MKLECTASALNIRTEPHGTVIGEMRSGDLFDVATANSYQEWVSGTVASGVSAGKQGSVRRKWLVQAFDDVPALSRVDRRRAARIVADRTREFDAITYRLGEKAKTWRDLARNGYVDCSGWIYLVAKDLIGAYATQVAAPALFTYSDEQICNVGRKTGAIISGRYLRDEHFVPGVLVGIDFAEYSWDRNRPLDIDHIIVVGSDADGPFVSQSSSSGAGVNRVPLDKWLTSQRSLIDAGRVHLVDLLATP